METVLRHILYVTKQICTRRLFTVALTHTGTQFLWVHLYCSHDQQHDLHDYFGITTVLLLLYSDRFTSVSYPYWLTDLLATNNMSSTCTISEAYLVFHRWASPYVFLPKVEACRIALLETRCVYILQFSGVTFSKCSLSYVYSTVFWEKKEFRMLLYSIITELHLKELIQTTTQKWVLSDRSSDSMCF
jgi:hypothetical protein